MTLHDDDRRKAEDHAQDFIRAAMLPGDMRTPMVKEPEMTVEQPVPPKNSDGQRSSMNGPAPHTGVQVRERNGIWEVQVDGKFRGDYHQKEHALAAAAAHRLAPR